MLCSSQELILPFLSSQLPMKFRFASKAKAIIKAQAIPSKAIAFRLPFLPLLLNNFVEVRCCLGKVVMNVFVFRALNPRPNLRFHPAP